MKTFMDKARVKTIIVYVPRSLDKLDVWISDTLLRGRF